MATETLELKTPEAASPLKPEDVVDSEKKEAPVSDDDDPEKKEEEKEKDEEADGESEEEEEEEKNGKTTEKEPVSSISGRPTRKRKRTERYILDTPTRSSASKPVSIEQGRGTRLKEIPNVAYKLSKRKPDDNLFLLHTILYGKKGKAQMLKKNIGQFSGFVWSEQEEEKQRAKAKEKLEKCIKEKLIDFCDVLDIPINKSNVKKEELAVRVLEFLVNPKATRDIVLADSEKKTRKRKKSSLKDVTSGESSDVPAKRRRQTKKSEKKEDQPLEGNSEKDVGSEGANAEDDTSPEKEDDKNEDTETDEKKDKSEEEKATGKKSTSKRTRKKKEKPASAEKKSVKDSAKSSRKSSKQVDKTTSSSSKKQKVDDKELSSKEKSKKQKSKPKANGSKDQGKTKKKAKKEPTRKELQIVVTKILKEVDFDTATLSDILRKLGSHFGVDLMHRKAEVKDIITDAIKEMSDDDDDEREETT